MKPLHEALSGELEEQGRCEGAQTSRCANGTRVHTTLRES